MTYREKLEQTAFWEGKVCVACGHTTSEEGEESSECQECGNGQMVEARELLALITRAEEEGND